MARGRLKSPRGGADGSGVSQLSRPYQFALVGVLVLAVAWMFVLRPSDEVAAEPPMPAASAPGVQGLAGAAAGAQGAVDASTASAAATQAAAASPTAQTGGAVAPAEAPAAAPAAATAKAKAAGAVARTPKGDPSRPILAALQRDKVAVVLFHEGAAAEDRAVRKALRGLPRRNGRVAVFSAPIARVGAYAAVTRGVSVLAAPTVLVIGPDHAARSVTGLTSVEELDQLVGDTLRRTRAAEPSAPGAA